MEKESISRKEIEGKISIMGDYVVMDYLSRCLKKTLDFDTKKYVLVKLAGLYENRKMYVDAGKMMNKAAEINTTFQNKINDFVKACELFIKGGNYELADISMKKIYSIAGAKQTEEIKNSIKNFYKSQARVLIKKDKRKNAMDVYERLLTLDLNEQESAEIRDKLLDLYEKLGKIKESNLLRKK